MFALKSFKEQLKLESEAILEGKVEIREIPTGFRIMEEDSLKVRVWTGFSGNISERFKDPFY